MGGMAEDLQSLLDIDLTGLEDTCDVGFGDIGGQDADDAMLCTPPRGSCPMRAEPEATDAMMLSPSFEADGKEVSLDAATLAKKFCEGCGCCALVPSPLCGNSQYRLGDYADWSGDWDKHCAALARIRFTPAHGSLLGVKKWLKLSFENKVFFAKCVIAYYSLKLEGTLQRVSFGAIDTRVASIEQLLTWSRCGVGLPLAMNFGNKQIVDLKEVVASGIGNPLLDGGVVQEMKYGGKVVLGVSMPVQEGDRGREDSFRLLEPGLTTEEFANSTLALLCTQRTCSARMLPMHRRLQA